MDMPSKANDGVTTWDDDKDAPTYASAMPFGYANASPDNLMMSNMTATTNTVIMRNNLAALDGDMYNAINFRNHNDATVDNAHTMNKNAAKSAAPIAAINDNAMNDNNDDQTAETQNDANNDIVANKHKGMMKNNAMSHHDNDMSNDDSDSNAAVSAQDKTMNTNVTVSDNGAILPACYNVETDTMAVIIENETANAITATQMLMTATLLLISIMMTPRQMKTHI
mmetsp:Transcript_50887/g.61326  ORF Transcript_50887/g.61326 Transcript_50887/m.61326 type:complete len:225 (+) Transcript_50887:782-1456(+)